MSLTCGAHTGHTCFPGPLAEELTGGPVMAFAWGRDSGRAEAGASLPSGCLPGTEPVCLTVSPAGSNSHTGVDTVGPGGVQVSWSPRPP